MKGVIQADHIPLNKVELVILGLPKFTFTSLDGFDDELETVDLPDRTTATGGNRLPSEFTAKHPMHHRAHELLLEAWYQESQDPVSPGYKKVGHITFSSLSGQTNVTYPLTGVYIKKRKFPPYEMKNAGEMAENEWTFKIDDIIPAV